MPFPDDGCRDQLFAWLKDAGLSHHSEILIAGGFDDLLILRDISDEEVADIITGWPKGHAQQFQRRVMLLRQNQSNVNSVISEDARASIEVSRLGCTMSLPEDGGSDQMSAWLKDAGLGCYLKFLLDGGYDDLLILRDISDEELADIITGWPKGHAWQFKRRVMLLRQNQRNANSLISEDARASIEASRLACFMSFPDDGGRDLMSAWLKDAGLSRYFQFLVDGGYDDLLILRDISDEELADIVTGWPKGHAQQFKRFVLIQRQNQRNVNSVISEDARASIEATRLACTISFPDDGGRDQMSAWLADAGLGRYFKYLMDDGYDDLIILRDISDEELADIITSWPKGHAQQFKRRVLLQRQNQSNVKSVISADAKASMHSLGWQPQGLQVVAPSSTTNFNIESPFANLVHSSKTWTCAEGNIGQMQTSVETRPENITIEPWTSEYQICTPDVRVNSVDKMHTSPPVVSFARPASVRRSLPSSPPAVSFVRPASARRSLPSSPPSVSFAGPASVRGGLPSLRSLESFQTRSPASASRLPSDLQPRVHKVQRVPMARGLDAALVGRETSLHHAVSLASPLECASVGNSMVSSPGILTQSASFAGPLRSDSIGGRMVSSPEILTQSSEGQTRQISRSYTQLPNSRRSSVATGPAAATPSFTVRGSLSPTVAAQIFTTEDQADLGANQDDRKFNGDVSSETLLRPTSARMSVTPSTVILTQPRQISPSPLQPPLYTYVQKLSQPSLAKQPAGDALQFKESESSSLALVAHSSRTEDRVMRNGLSVEERGYEASRPDATMSIKELLLHKNKPRLEEEIKTLYRKSAGQNAYLSPDQMEDLSGALAIKLRIPKETFGNIHTAFWHYDFTSGGYLNEEEAIMCIYGLLKAYQKSQNPAIKNLHNIRHDTLEDNYTDLKLLSAGTQGVVYLATKLPGRQERVVKFYDKSSNNMNAADVVTEFSLLKSLDHPKIARYYDFFQDAKNIYVIQEPYYGGDFGSAVSRAKEAGVRITYSWLGDLWKQAAEGLAYLHSQHVMHQDIKEGNIMISDKEHLEHPNVVVVDFGLAEGFNAGSRHAGSPGYMPPEVWEKGLWTPKGDVFAMGVTMYRMVSGQFPFGQEGFLMMNQGGTTWQELMKESTLKCQLPEPVPPLLEHMLKVPGNDRFYDLLKRMLKKEHRGRPSFNVVLKDPWFREVADTNSKIDTASLNKLAAVQHKNELYVGLLADLASKENLSQLEDLSRMFIAMDTDNDGLISCADARQALEGKLAPEKIEELIKTLIGSHGMIPYTVFMGHMLARKEANDAEMLWILFKEIDKNGDGELDKRELEELLQRPNVAEVMQDKSADELLQEMDTSNDGTVSWNEFRKALAPFEKLDAILRVGSKCHVYDNTFLNSWIPCEVTDIDACSQSIQLSSNPGRWYTKEEQDKFICNDDGSGTESDEVSDMKLDRNVSDGCKWLARVAEQHASDLMKPILHTM